MTGPPPYPVGPPPWMQRPSASAFRPSQMQGHHRPPAIFPPSRVQGWFPGAPRLPGPPFSPSRGRCTLPPSPPAPDTPRSRVSERPQERQELQEVRPGSAPRDRPAIDPRHKRRRSPPTLGTPLPLPLPLPPPPPGQQLPPPPSLVDPLMHLPPGPPPPRSLVDPLMYLPPGPPPQPTLVDPLMYLPPGPPPQSRKPPGIQKRAAGFLVPRNRMVVPVPVAQRKEESSFDVRMRGRRCCPAPGEGLLIPTIADLGFHHLGQPSNVIANLHQVTALLNSTDISQSNPHMVLEIAQESLRVLEALEVTSFMDFISRSVPLQCLSVFPDVAAFAQNFSAQNARFQLKAEVRRVLDSLMIQSIGPLLGEPISSFAGKLKVNDVIVSKGRCSFRRRPDEFKVLHSWLDSLFPPGPCRPALLDHLLSLLLSFPTKYDSSPEVKKAYLLSVRNHVWLASFARQQTLLINFGKLLKCLNPSDLTKLESALKTSGGNSHKWIDFVDQIKVMDDVKRRRETAKEKIPLNKKDNLLGLSQFLRVFEVHAPEYLLNSNHESVLKHFEEVHHIMQSFFEDDLADLYGALLSAWDKPLVQSVCDCYEGRG